MVEAGLSMLVLAGTALGLAALFLDRTGDGRGIDYIQPGKRFQSGYKLPLPVTLLAMGAAVGVAAMFASGMASTVNLTWGRPTNA
ncbi:MAG: hypothetical protein CL696_10735 [Chloroflexi bacterium]|jgi:hypothetical protein|nr:hypothetical protein [Chloroflexota bacterium]|tara:strand:- start:157 stop:411 length:255 start_codon:yes stop_codon:yes gene_type:complete